VEHRLGDRANEVTWQLAKDASDVAAVAEPIGLGYQRGHVTLHVSAQLSLQRVPISAVIVKHYGARLIQARASSRQDAIPEFRVFRATGCAGAKPRVEQANALESGPTKGHVGACPYPPDMCPVVAGLLKEGPFEQHRDESAPEPAHLELKALLGARFQAAWQDEPGHRLGAGLAKGPSDLRRPARMRRDIIIGEREQAACRSADSGIARPA
jgi:hypothetical protein